MAAVSVQLFGFRKESRQRFGSLFSSCLGFPFRRIFWVAGLVPVPDIQSASITNLRAGRLGFPDLSILGAVAQLGERLICIQEVAGSIPTSSTKWELIWA